jgi:hypothetical protein
LPPFERSVFVNCPFDEEYAPLLQAIAFCIVLLEHFPRFAPENTDNAEPRLSRIAQLVNGSKFGIHDLSRCRADAKGEYARMNMPFELGLDYACRRFGASELQDKRILVLESRAYDYQKALSDIAGWDIRTHQNDYAKAVAHVRNWLSSQSPVPSIGTSRILGKYTAFQEWYWEKELAAGSSEDDIREYPSDHVVRNMHEWMATGQPTSFDVLIG